MPIPKPKKTEKKNEFISRCMKTLTNNKDFEDKEQRAAVCYSEWDDSINEEVEDQDPYTDKPQVEEIENRLEILGLVVDRDNTDFLINTSDNVDEFISLYGIEYKDQPIDGRKGYDNVNLESLFHKLNKITKKEKIHFNLYDVTTGDLLFSNMPDEEFNILHNNDNISEEIFQKVLDYTNEEGVVAGDVAQYHTKIGNKNKKKKTDDDESDIIKRINKILKKYNKKKDK